MAYSRILTYYNEAKILYNGGICKPRTAIIYPVYGCNLDCKGCICQSDNYNPIYMDFEKFKKLITELKEYGVESIEFCGGGEPLLHPYIKEMITYITEDKKLAFGIMTNGILLDDEISNLIINNASYIRISLYDSTFYEVFDGLKKLIELKKSNGSTIEVSSKLLVSNRNIDMIPSQCVELTYLDLNLISIKAERNSECEITVQQAKELSQLLKQINSEVIVVGLEKSIINEKCWMSPIHALIDPYGDLYICCYYVNRPDKHRIGNVFEKTFSQIWASQIHKEKINNIVVDECNLYDCRWHSYNKQMRNLLDGNKVYYLFC
ncbi:radical SAM protein [Alkaliphilus serpentinus]|uniref:Radical SAM protein n=1 Tax=Alkaliphilus serpentinus TaxID=1482731 RepID=A0A833HNR2_9FIRM|nr:radical SAM protein [Alkaliphilus serpentinus]KAB3529855.1 radical SAM protein [Alkaliphilus serpentinus]